MGSLKQRMFDAYGGFSDKRVKDLSIRKTFVLDDRKPQDRGADGNLHSYFCVISADVAEDTLWSEERLDVSLSGNVPHSEDVESWAKENRATYAQGSTLHFQLAEGEQSKLRTLAAVFRRIAPSNSRPTEPSYFYVCPRTAASLERLAQVLDRESDLTTS